MFSDRGTDLWIFDQIRHKSMLSKDFHRFDRQKVEKLKSIGLTIERLSKAKFTNMIFMNRVQTWAARFRLSMYVSIYQKIYSFYPIITKLGQNQVLMTEFHYHWVENVDFLIKHMYYESLNRAAQVCRIYVI